MENFLTFPANDKRSWAGLRERWSGRHPRSIRESRPDAATAQALARINGGVAVTDKRIWLNGLPDAFRGFRILQLSDIHHSLFVPLDRVAAVVELSNLLKPDLVALTGDFRHLFARFHWAGGGSSGGLTGRPLESSRCLATTIFAWVRRRLRERCDASIYDVLRNRHVELRESGDRLYVAGVDDYRIRRRSGRGAAWRSQPRALCVAGAQSPPGAGRRVSWRWA